MHAGRYHLLNSATNKPIGTYTAVITGLGRFNMQYDAALGTVTLPTARTRRLPDGRYLTYLDVPVTKNEYDIMLIIYEQNATAPITSFKLYAPGCCDALAATCNATCSATYNPTYLKTVSGFHGVRTMDWQKTNGANLANWADRNTPAAISQDRTIARVARIQSINCWNPATPPVFFNGQPLALVTTSAPHNFTTGQLVKISSTAGGYMGSGAAALASFDLDDAMVFVVDVTSFAYSLAGWWGTPQITSCTAGGAAGWARILISTGVAPEYVVEMAQLLSTDPWVTVPHLATDAFISSMAEWWAVNLPAGRKLYVELSNEVRATVEVWP